MVLMRDHTLQMSKFYHQATFVRKIIRICTLFVTLQFVSRKSEIQVLSLSSKYSQLIIDVKTNLLYFLTIGPLQLA